MQAICRILTFQFLWFLFIKGSNAIPSSLIVGSAAGTILIDKYIFYRQQAWKPWLTFVLAVSMSGWLIDTLSMWSGALHFPPFVSPFPPFWLLSIWIIFIPYYQFAFPKLRPYPNLTFFLGFVGAPMAYSAATQLTEFYLSYDYHLLTLALLWGIFFPSSIWFHHTYVAQNKYSAKLN